MSNKSVAKLGEMAEEGVDGLIAAGFQMHGYRQGTKECIAFYRGFLFALKIAKEAAKAKLPLVVPADVRPVHPGDALGRCFDCMWAGKLTCQHTRGVTGRKA